MFCISFPPFLFSHGSAQRNLRDGAGLCGVGEAGGAHAAVLLRSHLGGAGNPLHAAGTQGLGPAARFFRAGVRAERKIKINKWKMNEWKEEGRKENKRKEKEDR